MWVGPGRLEENPQQSQDLCIVTYSPPSASRGPNGYREAMLPCPPPRSKSFRLSHLHVLDVWLEAWQVNQGGRGDFRPGPSSEVLILS